MSEKLQKVLANMGMGSRRGLEVWITEGRIRVNGKVAKLGDRVEEMTILWWMENPFAMSNPNIDT